jgi:DNA-directed RNA polymerase
LNQIFMSKLIFESNRMPTIVPPMPWFSTTQGGYFLSKSNLLRLDDTRLAEQKLLIDEAHPSKINIVYDALNSLSACPWRVNANILDL